MSLQTILLLLILAIMLISITVGLIQGFRKSMYKLCATILFWVIFWITAPLLTGKFIFDNEGIYSALAGVLPTSDGDFSSCKTLIDYLVITLSNSLEIEAELMSDPAVKNTLISIIQNVVKLVYLFVLAIVYAILRFFAWHLIFKRFIKINKRKLRKLEKKKNRYVEKHKKENPKLEKRYAKMEKGVRRNKLYTKLGMASGAARGLLCSFVILSLINSTMGLLPTLKKNDITANNGEETPKEVNLYDFILEQTDNDPIVKAAIDIIADYQASTLMKATGNLDELFIDSILSGKAEDYSFKIRKEMSSIIQIAEKAFYATNGFDVENIDFTKLTEGQVKAVEDMLVILSDTDLLNNLGSVLVGTALSLEAVAPYMPTNMSTDEYANIDWSSELKTIAKLVSEVYSLTAEMDTVNYLELDTEKVKQITTTLSELESINFLGHVASAYAFKSLVEEDPAYAEHIENIEIALADMALNGKFAEDVASFGTMYEQFITILGETDFSKWEDEEGKVNYIAAITDVDATLYGNLVSNILETNFLTEIFPDVLVIMKDKLIAQDNPELAAMINPNVTTSAEWEEEINTVLGIIADMTAHGEKPFEGIEKYDFSQLRNIRVETIVESELLSYAMIKMLVDTSKGQSVLTKDEDESELSEMICVPDYLAVDAVEDKDGNLRYHSDWYGYNEDHSDGELHIMLTTLFDAFSYVESIEAPVKSLPAIIDSIDADLLTSSNVLYYSMDKLIKNYGEILVVPVTVTEESIHEVDGEKLPNIIRKDELKNLIGILQKDEQGNRVIDLDSLYTHYIIDEETGEEIIIDASEATDETKAKLELDNMMNLLTSNTLYDPENPDDSTALDKLFSSDILRATITNMVNESAGEFITIPNKAKDSPVECIFYKENELTGEKELVTGEEANVSFIKKAEFKSLIMALRDLDIDLEAITGEDAMTLIDSFKEEDGSLKAEANQIFGKDGYTGSKYSAILHATVSSYVIDEANKEEPVIVVPNTIVEGEFISGNEVVNLLNAVVYLGNDILEGDADKDEIIGKVIDNNDILDSVIIRATVTKYINETGEITVPNSVYDEHQAVTKGELDKLLTAFDEIKGDSEESYLDLFKDDALTIGRLSNNSEAIADSLILRSTITTKLENLNNEETTVLVLPLDAYDADYLSKQEVTNVLASLEKLYTPNTTIKGINGVSGLTVGKLSSLSDDINASYILRATVTKELVDLDEKGSIVLTVDAYDKDATLQHSYVDKGEIKVVLSILSDFFGENTSIDSISAVGDLTFDKLIAKDTEDNLKINNSYILRATIAEKLAESHRSENGVVLPMSAYDTDTTLQANSYIKKDELENMLLALTSLYGTKGINDVNMSSIEMSTIKNEVDNGTIADSIILRATITSNVEFTADGQPKDVFVFDSQVDKTVDIDNNSIVIFTKAELTNLVSSLNALSSDGTLAFDINMETLQVIASKPEILDSSLLCIAVGDFMLENITAAQAYFATKAPTNVVKLPSGESQTRVALTKDEILAFLATFLSA